MDHLETAGNINSAIMSAYELEPCLKVPLPESQLLEVVEKAKDWALMNGAALRSKDHFSKDILQVAPFILLPSSLPRYLTFIHT